MGRCMNQWTEECGSRACDAVVPRLNQNGEKVCGMEVVWAPGARKCIHGCHIQFLLILGYIESLQLTPEIITRTITNAKDEQRYQHTRRDW